MRNYGHGKFLDLLGRDKLQAIEQRQRLGRFHQGD